MASTTPTNVDTSIPEHWSKDSLRRSKVSGFWGRFTGGVGSGAPIIQKSELKDSPGDLIHIQVTDPLSGAGITGDTAVLVGNEEALATTEIKVSPMQYRHGVRLFRRADKKSILGLRSEARVRLEEWQRNKMDLERFRLLTATALDAPLGAETYAPTVYRPNARANTAAVVAGDTLSVRVLQEIKLKLSLALAKPIDVDGTPVYILVAHPNATFQLKQEARYESWVRDARERGADNPFFRGALAMIDGMVIHEHPNVPTVNSTIKVGKGIAFGAEAFVEGLDENTSYDEDTFDYGNEYGLAVKFAFAPRRALELSSLQVETAAVDV